MAQGFSQGGAVALALTTGVVTAFNPCGFAMLPGYVSYFVGSNAASEERSTASRIARAGVVGTAVTAGFVAVFGLLGLAATGVRSTISDIAPYITMVIAVVMIALGVAMIRGFEPKLSFIRVQRSGSGTGIGSMFAYGVGYALVSLSCAFPPFLLNVASTFGEDSLARSALLYLAFAGGMGLVLLTLTIAVSLAQQQVVSAMRRAGRYVGRVSGVLLVLAGAYFAWYGYYDYRLVVRGEVIDGGPVDAAFRVSQTVQDRLSNLSTPVLVAAIAVVGGLVVASIARSRSRDRLDG